MVEFAEKFKQLREQKQLSQQDVAKRLLIQTDEVQKWENGETLPDTATMLKLSEMFGVSLDYLIRGEETATIVYSEKDARQEFTDAEVHRIAYKYLLIKMRLLSLFIVVPMLFAFGVWMLVIGIGHNSDSALGGGILIFILALLVAIIGGCLLYRSYKKEKSSLEEQYGKEFVNKASLKLLIRFDKSLYDDRDKTKNKH